ncbi:mitochondrial putative Sam component AgMTX_2 [Andalucia godoyi]|uniref:Mitochondrial putative Sam component AgMTX_2 n=1 Tax=Andalucia godoyi TaxID=505711 RepID=A0A8K0F4L6_ANDGO|nr:mitochondrial putative Sam component AgMTX_2 [Andalucia godoyi]|eukprot:ANDGO_00258.mRNA.1 mitochondrial putative Sam component AgMTX_2 (metaxin homolog: GST_N_Metaxin and GST_C_Metaxin domain-containing protein)
MTNGGCIELVSFPGGWGIVSNSPFCLKLDAYLRMSGIPYKMRLCGDPRTAPKGKLPYIVLENGTDMIADSGECIDFLEERSGAQGLDANLTEDQKADALCVRRTVEEHLYWVMVYSRWVDPQGWNHMYNLVKESAGLPWFIAPFILPRIQKKVIGELHGHGIGRHDPDVIYRMGRKDVDAISAKLGQRKFYFGGSKPTTIDACLYGTLIGFLKCPWDNVIKSHLLENHTNLVAYANALHEMYYPSMQDSEKK